MESRWAPGQSQKMDVALSIEVQQQNVNVSDQAIGLDTSAENNVSQMVLSGKDLDALSDDPDELADRPAGAGGSVSRAEWRTDLYRRVHRRAVSAQVVDSRDSHQPESLFGGVRQAGLRPHRDLHQAGDRPISRADFGAGEFVILQLDEPICDEQSGYDTTQYTANVGGPMGKKTSFFINFERRNIGDNAIVNAFVLDPRFRAGTVRHVGPDSAHTHQRQPAYGFSTHPEQHVERAVPVVAEQSGQSRRRAVLVADPGVQPDDDGADAAAQRYATVRNESSQRNPLPVPGRPHQPDAVLHRCNAQRARRVCGRRQQLRVTISTSRTTTSCRTTRRGC